MELCECERNKEAVEKFQFFSLGTLHPLIPRIPVPKHSCIAWKCNKANHDDYRPNRPVLIFYGPDEEKKEEVGEEPLEPKWIPVLPGVISQKAVNECKQLDAPF